MVQKRDKQTIVRTTKQTAREERHIGGGTQEDRTSGCGASEDPAAGSLEWVPRARNWDNKGDIVQIGRI